MGLLSTNVGGSKRLLKFVGIKLPKDCLCLDYYQEKYRLGTQLICPNYSFSSLKYVDASALGFTKGIKGIKDSKIPVAEFNNSNVGSWARQYSTYYPIDTQQCEQGWSIEFYLNCDSCSGWVHECTKLLSNASAAVSMHSYTYGLYFGYTTSSNYWSWDNYQNIGSWTQWNHVAYTYTRSGNKLKVFINGNLYFNVTVYKEFSSIAIHSCMFDSNNLYYYGGYRITQFAIWNYPKYTQKFTPSTLPILN